MIRFVFILCSIAFSLVTSAQDKQYVNLGAQKIEIADKTLLAVTFKNTKGWHTYWKNPGDAGLAVKVKFYTEDNKQLVLKDYPWPAPKRYIEQGDMWAYGYSGKYAFFFDLPNKLINSKIKIVGEWLVCKDICIPGTRTVSFPLSSDPILTQGELKDRFQQLPTTSKMPTNIKLYLTKTENPNELALHYLIEEADFSKVDSKVNLITPYHAFPFDYKHEEIFFDRENKSIYGRALIDWDGIYEDPIWEMPHDGVFDKIIKPKFLLNYPKGEKSKIITKEFKVFSTSENKLLDQTYARLDKVDFKNKAQLKVSQSKGILYYIFFAFLGGLILNLMPCVLPVISLKLFGLIGHAKESKKRILRHNLFYTLGVVSSFVVLATVVFALKASGDQIGWGFQLQSPVFVFMMLVLIFIMALNMLGLFEFRTPGGTRLGGIAQKDGVVGDFNNGVLATILSTPCSAPFLGSALPFAFTTTTLNIYIIFIAVGLGLSFPFILTGLFPALISFLPKPGAWMDNLKKFLGLSLILTSVWLYDVLGSLISMEFSGIYINTILALIFFAFYFRRHISVKLRYNIIIFLLPIAFIFLLFNIRAFDSKPEQQNIVAPGSLQWTPWTPKEMEEAKSIKGYTFINFTAAWCLTCKINKKIVLQSSDFKDLVKQNQIKLIEGDWTQRDDKITEFLRSYNIVGVPAYFLVKPSGEVVSLGETISISKIKESL